MILIEIINDKKVWVYDKEESLLEVEKSLTSLLSNFDVNTEAMVQKLHQAREREVICFKFQTYKWTENEFSLHITMPSVEMQNCLISLYVKLKHWITEQFCIVLLQHTFD